MEITLSFQGETPIYEQIETQIRNQILAGTLEAGESIPSMRALAKMLKVSVITVQKAYENLKKEGLIESVVGRGTVVSAANKQALNEARRKDLETKIEEVLKLSKEMGLPLDELVAWIRMLGEDES